MKKTFVGLVAGFAILAFGATAKAEILTVALDFPVAYGFSDSALSADGMPSGTKISLNFIAFPVGIGVENYTVATDGGADITFQMYDLFYTAPIPIVNVVLGIGFGTATYDSATSALVDDAGLTQYWFSLGFPIFPLIDIHLGYHSVTGTGSGTPDLVLDGTMTSLGVKVGF